ncbi:prepilin peptidase [Parvularcula oceani]|uniref:prepilin peptidase n=1 Tax=Parvularcula oceani TaxID=1247963 RepID=UPI0004E14A62|nr:A24 family peptidase [Parvularcula oceani]
MMLAVFAILGLILGSFCNVVISRGPVLWGLSEEPRPQGPFDLSRPRSHCPSCKRTLAPAELVPLLSYAVLRGRCRQCGARIAGRYPLIELLGGLAGIAAVLCAPGVAGAAFLLGFLLLLLAAAAIDAETGYLPDALTGPALWLALLAAAAGLSVPPGAAIIGAAAGYAAFRGIAGGYAALRGREGLGRGDAKLLAAGGAALGPLALPFVVLASAACALAVIAAAAARGRPVEGGTALRFGPYLAGGIALVLLAEAALPGRVVPPWPLL